MATASPAPTGLTADQLAEVEFLLKRRADFERKADPCQFIPYFLQSELWELQEEICAAISQPGARVAVKACHSSGKTFVAARIILWFLAQFEKSTVISTAPTDLQI